MPKVKMTPRPRGRRRLIEGEKENLRFSLKARRQKLPSPLSRAPTRENA